MSHKFVVPSEKQMEDERDTYLKWKESRAVRTKNGNVELVESIHVASIIVLHIEWSVVDLQDASTMLKSTHGFSKQ